MIWPLIILINQFFKQQAFPFSKNRRPSLRCMQLDLVLFTGAYSYQVDESGTFPYPSFLALDDHKALTGQWWWFMVVIAGMTSQQPTEVTICARQWIIFAYVVLFRVCVKNQSTLTQYILVANSMQSIFSYVYCLHLQNLFRAQSVIRLDRIRL